MVGFSFIFYDKLVSEQYNTLLEKTNDSVNTQYSTAFFESLVTLSGFLLKKKKRACYCLSLFHFFFFLFFSTAPTNSINEAEQTRAKAKKQYHIKKSILIVALK